MPGDYNKPLTQKDRECLFHLQIFHPELLNPKYFEMAGEEEEEEE